MTETSNPDNIKKALAFLKALHGDGRINLVAIDPNSLNVTAVTRPLLLPQEGNSVERYHPDIEAFIHRHIDYRNIYFTVNTPKDDAPDNKLKKEHIAAINAVWLDADPDKKKPFKAERDRLLKFAKELAESDNPPTCITDSGGGIQAFWMLDKPLSPDGLMLDGTTGREYAESMSRGLAEQYGTDKVQNIDRIMRLPYTWNLPTAKKKDRVKTLARSSRIGRKYSHGEFPAFIEPSFAAETDNEIDYGILDMDHVKATPSQELLDKFKKIRKSNKKIDDLWTNKIDMKPSRSERDFAMAKELKGEGFSLLETAQILWSFPHGKNKTLTKREIIRDYERSGNDFVSSLDAAAIERIEKQINPIISMRQQIIAKKEERKKSRRGRVHASQASHKISGIPIIKNFFDRQSTVLLFGPPNSGKSFVTLDIGMAIASGQKKWGHFKIKEKMGVLVVCGEAGQSYGKRVEATRKRFGFNDKTTYAELPFAHLDNYYDLMSDKDHLKEIREEILGLEKDSGIKCGLLIIDTLSSTFGSGNENAAEDARKYLNNLKQIGHDLKVTILIVHHTGKDEASGARGSSVFLGDVDTQLRVSAVKRGEKYERTVISTKQRDTEKDQVTKFGLQVVELALDDDGDPVTTCKVSLETDDDFEDVTPDKEAQLDHSARCALQAIRIYNRISNPDIERLKSRHGEVQLKALIHHDLVEGNGIINPETEKFEVDDLLALAKSSEKIRKAFGRGCDVLRVSGFTQESVKHQLVSLGTDGT